MDWLSVEDATRIDSAISPRQVAKQKRTGADAPAPLGSDRIGYVEQQRQRQRQQYTDTFQDILHPRDSQALQSGDKPLTSTASNDEEVQTGVRKHRGLFDFLHKLKRSKNHRQDEEGSLKRVRKASKRNGAFVQEFSALADDYHGFMGSPNGPAEGDERREIDHQMRATPRQDDETPVALVDRTRRSASPTPSVVLRFPQYTREEVSDFQRFVRAAESKKWEMVD